MCSSDLRLAMHVEDHPIEYGDFEGVIPSGYGAGIVMLWDRGTWTPEVDDVEAALAKGDLKLRLDGYKLKGSWALVRTKGWPGASRRSKSEDGEGGESRSWLLIKHKDAWASPELDILEFAPLSVKSEGDFADILASVEREVNAAAEQALAAPKPDPQTATHFVFSPDVDPTSEAFATDPAPTGGPDTMVAAINATLRDEMAQIGRAHV